MTDSGFEAILGRLFAQSQEAARMAGLRASQIDGLPRATDAASVRHMTCAICQECLIPDAGAREDAELRSAVSGISLGSGASASDDGSTAEDLEEEIIILPACDHRFHAPCVIPWLLRVATCPMCRVEVTAVSP